jgi:predicted nuclease of predicted toxin-antitoxin system
MHILANESFPGPVIRALRDRGHDVVSVKEIMRGADDRTVVDLARKEGRLVVTFDKDFGELAFRLGLPAQSGVVLFRLSGPSPEVDNARALTVLESREDWQGNFAVVTHNLIRIRPLPQ